LSIDIPAEGAIQVMATGSSPVLRTGSVSGSFNTPVLAVEELQNWRNSNFANGASVNASGISLAFETFADRRTGIAIANPNSTALYCGGSLADGYGLGSHSLTL